MNILSWLPLGRKVQPEGASSAPSTGGSAPAHPAPLTGCDLSQVSPLVRPFAQDPFYRLRPPFSAEAAQMSLELAHMAYTLDLEPWRAAGWTDFSILIDDSLHSGLSQPQGGDALAGVISRVKVLRAKAAMREVNPVSQVLSALRQKERSDTIKAVCMMHPLPDEKWLLAIGFMGTGKRFYDWFSNFRFTPEEGFHKGFNQLCESFQLHAEEIVFPAAAGALGLERLSLGQVLGDLRSLHSPFRLWMAGHSQGSAVMQVFTHRLMNDWGVLPQNMVGYGFASPTVATGKFVYDPAAYPLYHILSTDDVVPRLGALLHLGMCLEYAPDDAFRQAIYPPPDPQEKALREELAFLANGIDDTPSGILHMIALLECLAQEKGADGLSELLTSWWAAPTVDRVLWRAGDKALDGLKKILNNAKAGYLALTKKPAKPEEIVRIREKLRPIVQKTSVRRLLGVFSDYAVPPHTLEDAYAAITMHQLENLEPFIWLKVRGALPAKRYAGWRDASLWPEECYSCRLHTRRMPLRALPAKGKLRMSLTAQKR